MGQAQSIESIESGKQIDDKQIDENEAEELQRFREWKLKEREDEQKAAAVEKKQREPCSN